MQACTNWIVTWQYLAHADPFVEAATEDGTVNGIAFMIFRGECPDIDNLAKDTPGDVVNLMKIYWDPSSENHPKMIKVAEQLGALSVGDSVPNQSSAPWAVYQNKQRMAKM